jgi:hypothetical protein
LLAALALFAAQVAPAQFAKKPPVSKGPRALGLVELAPKGKAHLVPIAIMYDGQFYDASAYKAAPVPMALESHTVYEGFHAGVSQGFFTVIAAQQRPHSWVGEGTWLAAGAVAAQAGRRAETKPREDEDPKPPVLRHADSPPSQASGSVNSPPAAQTPASSTASSNSPVPSSDKDSDRPVLHRPKPEPEEQAPSASPPAPSTPPVPPPEEKDKDQPMLRRGKPALAPPEPPASRAAVASKAPATPPSTSAPGNVAPTELQIMTAISDAGGPDPRPYTYALKPDEEVQFRKKVLALAADEIRARSQQLASEMIGAPSPAHAGKTGHPAKPPQPPFEDVQLRTFDLSNSNEPVLVLTAKAHLPRRLNDPMPDLQYMVALVARQDIYGDLHKAFSNVTDTQHLDVLPFMEFIDAVDADGDGRGELLFRQTSDAGSAFVIYRVIGNQLWALFQGMPQ